MSYVETVLQSGEQVVARGEIHWIVFKNAILWTCASIFLSLVVRNSGLSVLLFVVAAVLIIEAWLTRWITEIAITTQRIIYKKGFISRHTAEMNIGQVESVTVDQSILGRLLDYGTIHIRGTGSGIEHIHAVSDPITFRNTILQ